MIFLYGLLIILIILVPLEIISGQVFVITNTLFPNKKNRPARFWETIMAQAGITIAVVMMVY